MRWIGVAVLALTVVSSAAAAEPMPWYGMSYRWHRDSSGVKFLLLERVASRGPAARAGLRPGDIITAIDGVAVGFGDELDFLLFLGDHKPGAQVRIAAVRNGRVMRPVLIVDIMPEAARARWEEALRVAAMHRRRSQPH